MNNHSQSWRTVTYHAARWTMDTQTHRHTHTHKHAHTTHTHTQHTHTHTHIYIYIYIYIYIQIHTYVHFQVPTKIWRNKYLFANFMWAVVIMQKCKLYPYNSAKYYDWHLNHIDQICKTLLDLCNKSNSKLKKYFRNLFPTFEFLLVIMHSSSSSTRSGMLWWDVVTSNGRTGWQVALLVWKRWPHTLEAWDILSTVENFEPSAKLICHWFREPLLCLEIMSTFGVNVLLLCPEVFLPIELTWNRMADDMKDTLSIWVVCVCVCLCVCKHVWDLPNIPPYLHLYITFSLAKIL